MYDDLIRPIDCQRQLATPAISIPKLAQQTFDAKSTMADCDRCHGRCLTVSTPYITLDNMFKSLSVRCRLPWKGLHEAGRGADASSSGSSTGWFYVRSDTLSYKPLRYNRPTTGSCALVTACLCPLQIPICKPTTYRFKFTRFGFSKFVAAQPWGLPQLSILRLNIWQTKAIDLGGSHGLSRLVAVLADLNFNS